MLLLPSPPLQYTKLLEFLRCISMCKLLQFPAPDDPRPEPPASALSVPRPGELSVLGAVSVHALSAPPKSAGAPFILAATAAGAV